MDDDLAQWQTALSSIDLVKWAMAETLVQKADNGTWKGYAYADDYEKEHLRGKHPRGFGGYLEGLTWDLRQEGYDWVSRGTMERLMDVFRWAAGLGMDRQALAYLGVSVMLTAWRLWGKAEPEEAHRELLGLAATKAQFGKLYLPALDMGPRPKYGFETVEHDADHYRVISFNVWRDGARQRNIIDKPALHLACKALRARHIQTEAPDARTD